MKPSIILKPLCCELDTHAQLVAIMNSVVQAAGNHRITYQVEFVA